MIALVSPQCLTPRASAGRSIYDLSKNICPTTRRNIPLLRFVSPRCRSSPAFRVASSAPEARRRCMRRLWKATLPWSSSWSLRRPRWTQPRKTTAVAPERFSGRFGSGSDEVTEGVRTLAADFRAVLWDVELYSPLLFKDPLLWWDDGMGACCNSGVRNGQTWRAKAWVEWKAEGCRRRLANDVAIFSVTWFDANLLRLFCPMGIQPLKQQT